MPSECHTTIVQSPSEKYSSARFHHFCAKYFSSFQNFAAAVLDTVTTELNETGADPINQTPAANRQLVSAGETRKAGGKMQFDRSIKKHVD